jgi:predicted enzyme related to lactoylglutathione lyase
MKVNEHKPGSPCWIDLGSPDVAASIAFYTALFGWTAYTTPDPAAGGYTVFHQGDSPVAGVGPLFAEGQPTAWSWYAATTDADETARKVEAAGGKVLMAPFDVLDAGRMAAFLDVNGTAFSVWQAGQMTGAGVLREPGALTWVELMTRDPDPAIEFYTRVFGWSAKPSSNPEMPYTEFHFGDEFFGGLMPMIGDEWPAELPDHWMVYFAVEDTDATCARIQELGGTVSVPPSDIPNVGRFAVVGDPAGAFFSVLTMTGHEA